MNYVLFAFGLIVAVQSGPNPPPGSNITSMTTLPPNGAPVPLGPTIFGGSGAGYWEETPFPKCKLCVPGNRISFDVCSKLIKPFILTTRYHLRQKLTNLTDGSCVYLTNGPANESSSDVNSTIRCMVTGQFQPRKKKGTFDDIRFHFYNLENNITDTILSVAYWGKSWLPVNCVATPMGYY